MNRLSNEQQIQKFLDWLRKEKKYTIAHQFNRPDPGVGAHVYASPKSILYNRKALSEVEFTDQQLLNEFFHGIRPPEPLEKPPRPPQPWWQKLDGGWCGCIVVVILIVILVSYCSHLPH
jgi:hypothetical protein